VNYLSPVLLTQLLLPALDRSTAADRRLLAGASAGAEKAAGAGGGAGDGDPFSDPFFEGHSGGGGRVGGRVVHVTCDAALQMPDWMPWPLR